MAPDLLDSVPSEGPDTVLRALSEDGNFRVMACRTTATAAGAVAAQRARGKMAELVANMVTATVLVRECMAPDLRLQAVLQGPDRKTRIVADSHPDGMTRALVQAPALASGVQPHLDLRQGAILQVQRTLHNGAMHQGSVEVPAHGDVSAAFMAYMQESEQVTTMISVGGHWVGEHLVAAGGYIVQLLPEIERAKLAIMAERLEDFRDIAPLLQQGIATPQWLLDETLYGMPYTQVAERTVYYGCNCSAERVTASLASLPRSEVEELVSAGEILEIGCDFCGAEYKVHPERLRGLLHAN
jgi:molecular chaperone Hsp33